MSSDLFVPIYESEFHSDEEFGFPELQRIRWAIQGSIIRAAEYYLSEDEYVDSNRRWMEFIDAEAVSVIQSRIHPHIVSHPSSKAGIYRSDRSNLLKTFRAEDVEGCAHYQVTFNGDILDVICRGIRFGFGVFSDKA